MARASASQSATSLSPAGNAAHAAARRARAARRWAAPVRHDCRVPVAARADRACCRPRAVAARGARSSASMFRSARAPPPQERARRFRLRRRRRVDRALPGCSGDAAACGVASGRARPTIRSPPSPCGDLRAAHAATSPSATAYNIGRLRTRALRDREGARRRRVNCSTRREFESCGPTLLGARRRRRRSTARPQRPLGRPVDGRRSAAHTSHEQEALSLLPPRLRAPRLDAGRRAARADLCLWRARAVPDARRHELARVDRARAAHRLPLATGRWMAFGTRPCVRREARAGGSANADPTDAEVVAVLHRWLRCDVCLTNTRTPAAGRAARGLSVTIRSHL